MRIVLRIVLTGFIIALLVTAFIGHSIGSGILHPAARRLTPELTRATDEMLGRIGASREDFVVTASDGVVLRGWKVRPASPNGDWVMLFHGVSDNRAGMGHAELLLRHGYSAVMMDARGHGESGGAMATYGWKERYDTGAIADALYSTEKVHSLLAYGVSMGGAIALQSAAVEPRIAGVVAECPFSNLREVSYDYAGLHVSPWLGKMLFRPASFFGLRQAEHEGGFRAEDVSPEKAVSERLFPVLLICGTSDHTIPCRHAKRIYAAARGTRELWLVQGAGHAAALGKSPEEYERRVIAFFKGINASRPSAGLQN